MKKEMKQAALDYLQAARPAPDPYRAAGGGARGLSRALPEIRGLIVSPRSGHETGPAILTLEPEQRDEP